MRICQIKSCHCVRSWRGEGVWTPFKPISPHSFVHSFIRMQWKNAQSTCFLGCKASFKCPFCWDWLDLLLLEIGGLVLGNLVVFLCWKTTTELEICFLWNRRSCA
jgi:hypothetical protein